ncbi:hypothetical protein QZL74_14335 [Burkholderia gladioli pv. alliicola]|uniref:hypothetical protein n=1 Tax=Burkholderia gladioli TaxID=28095 RepID=UPI003D81800B
MNDRELLGLAAKAAGLVVVEDYDGSTWSHDVDEHSEQACRWNPLTDDGDALRLAVKLRLDLMPDAHSQEASTRSYSVCVEESNGDDPCAALRRAITRAAAEIGARITEAGGGS